MPLPRSLFDLSCLFSGSQALRHLGAGKALQSHPIVDGEEFYVLSVTAELSCMRLQQTSLRLIRVLTSLDNSMCH